MPAAADGNQSIGKPRALEIAYLESPRLPKPALLQSLRLTAMWFID
ncbi:hypothetical protein [Novipirellula maiorica]|nr:hypothetical protein [Rhodopirellula maiorica]